MKYLAVITILFLSLFRSIPAATEAEDLMHKGNVHYQNGRYQQAIENYEQILKLGFSGKSLYYNLANAYFKTGRLGYAILNYERALKLDPNDEDAQYNLKIANARTVDKIEVMPRLFFLRWWDALLNMFTVNGWTIVTFLIYLFFLSCIAMYFLSDKAAFQKLSVFAGIFTLFLFLCSVLFLSLKFKNDTNIKSGVIVEAAATAKLSPDEKSGDAFIIHEGLKVDLDDNVSNWIKIRLADGKIGWIQEKDLGII